MTGIAVAVTVVLVFHIIIMAVHQYNAHKVNTIKRILV